MHGAEVHQNHSILKEEKVLASEGHIDVFENSLLFIFLKPKLAWDSVLALLPPPTIDNTVIILF